MGVRRKQHGAEFKARVAMASLSGEKTLAQLSAEFGVHPTMISNWKQELVREAGDDRAGSGAVRNPAMCAAGDRAQQLLLPATAGICGGTRGFEAARSDFHQSSGVRQPPASGDAVAGGHSDWPSTRPAADEEARTMGRQAEAEHQQAASRAQDLPIPSARQDDRPAEPSVGR